MYKLTLKQQKQYDLLRSRFDISRREFLEYWHDTRRARAKSKRLKREGDALWSMTPSLTVNFLRSRKDFLASRKRNKRILSRRYKKDTNAFVRRTLYGNLHKAFGSEANKSIDMLDEFDDEELKEFFDENKEIQSILYDSDTQEMLRVIGESADRFEHRIYDFKGEI